MDLWSRLNLGAFNPSKLGEADCSVPSPSYLFMRQQMKNRMGWLDLEYTTSKHIDDSYMYVNQLLKIPTLEQFESMCDSIPSYDNSVETANLQKMLITLVAVFLKTEIGEEKVWEIMHRIAALDDLDRFRDAPKMFFEVIRNEYDVASVVSKMLESVAPTISTLDTDRQKQLRAWQMRIAGYRHHFNETQGINNT
jgi:glutaredoxin-related protein